ncbi:Nitrogen permease regulator 3 [Puttea exsequens]|nr:Nitrogen permease regulator 3 [Puttea exsequens]
MTLPLPPNPCLIAIVLVVKTVSEPYIAFHYPPRPGEDNPRLRDIFKDQINAEESTTSSSDDKSEDSTAEVLEVLREQSKPQNRESPPDVEAGSVSPRQSNAFAVNEYNPRWNDLFGQPSSVLAKLLCPPATSKKKRFEIGLNDNVFLGCPMFAEEDGTWRRKRKDRRSSSRSNITAERVRKEWEATRKRRPKTTSIDEEGAAISPLETETDDPGTSHDEEQNGSVGTDVKETVSQQDTGTGGFKQEPSSPEKPLTMFHVVFVLNPPILEYHLRVKEMYKKIVKKFSKALKLEQARTNFVAHEATIIASLTKHYDKPGSNQSLHTLYHDLISQSSLARALSTLYTHVSNSRIAHISFTPSHAKSFQIPAPSWVSSLPSQLSPQLPGLWLTTAHSMITADDDQTVGSQLGSHFTLLLLSDRRSIQAEISGFKDPLTEALNHFLHVCTPTKSFYKIAETSSIPLRQIQELALYLIQWRRAQAIPPLNKSDIYILSPNADMRKLASASSSFSKFFPRLPPLAQILGKLSVGPPRQYYKNFPSRDHKDAYMEILAWLMREGWVTQLRSFAWVRVPAQIKSSVDAAAAAANESDQSPQNTDTEESDSLSASTSSLEVPGSISSSRLRSNKSRSVSPTSSTHTTLPLRPATFASSPAVISNPRTASALPSQYLAAISAHVLQTQGAEVQAAWDKCVQYFDGKHALESIAVREGWKRKRVAESIGGWEELGVLVRARHW